MFFLVFEGLDGSGKSSLMGQLQSHLEKLNTKFIKTREPGGTIAGDQIRKLILTKSEHAPTPRTELLLYEASRAQRVDLVIRPALARKEWVLCDRFSASSVAGTAQACPAGNLAVDSSIPSSSRLRVELIRM